MAKRSLFTVTLAVVLTVVFSLVGAAWAQTVGVSWSDFQLERWRTDEAALTARLEELGADYISTDAQGSPEKQLTDIESLITRGANVIVIVAQDTQAVIPAISRAQAAGIPVVGYDRLIEAEDVFYLTFDNREVGRLQAQAVYDAQPTGDYAFIKGSPTDPNADILHAGQLDVLQSAIDAGDITVVGEQYTEDWLPEVAQQNMEQILTANNGEVAAVVASNDSTAGGVVSALSSSGLAGDVPVSGQDGDAAALNRIARGLQTVSVWKDTAELGRIAAEVAVALARGEDVSGVADLTTWDDGPEGVEMDAVLLEPIPITKDNLNVVIDAGWIDQATVCDGVDAASDAAPAVCSQ